MGARTRTLALDGEGGVYVAGGTDTVVFLATPNAYATQYPGGVSSAVAAKVDFSKTAGPRLDCVVNAATLAAGRNRFGPDGSIAPGEIISLFGEGFTPGPNLSVTFDGQHAPILYADTSQINAIVPFDVASGNPLTLVSVNNATDAIGGFKLPIAPASPGLFTRNGQLASLNEDGTVNSTANPAKAGSVVSLFLTGAGAYNLKIGDGEPGPRLPPFPTPTLGVSARISIPPAFAGQQAEILFAGQAPGLAAGLVQLNVRIPGDAPTGKVGIIVYVGDYPTGNTGNVPNSIEVR